MPHGAARWLLVAVLTRVLTCRDMMGCTTERENWGHNSAISQTIGDIRTVVSAQHAYASANGNAFDGHLPCLAAPTECLKGYSPNDPIFLDRPLATLEMRHGYERRLYPGPPVPRHGDIRSPTSVRSFAYVAVPTASVFGGTPSSYPGLCGDSDGQICYVRQGATPGVKDGRCDPCEEWYEKQ